jgi:glutathione S-transferase
MLELYHAEPVANSMKVLLCLKEKQIDFVSHYVDLLRFEQHEPAFIAINPNGQVPVLVHDGAVITESTVINEYLDEVFPAISLCPANLVDRAHMRVWNKFVDDVYTPSLSMIGWHTMLRRIAVNIEKGRLAELLARIPLKEQRDKWATIADDSFTEEQLADSKRKLGISVQKMEAMLLNSDYLIGNQFSQADVNSYAITASLARLFPDLMNSSATPRVVAWMERMNARPGVQAALAMPNKVPETLRVFGA